MKIVFKTININEENEVKCGDNECITKLITSSSPIVSTHVIHEPELRKGVFAYKELYGTL